MRKILCLLFCLSFLTACSSKKDISQEYPVFKLVTSEYPSWSTFLVMDMRGIIDGNKGELSEIEKKYGVDIVIEVADYDTCIQMYKNMACDATCLTNIDSVSPSLTRKTVFFLPTSTSDGADALLSLNSNLDELVGQKVFGLEKSVSQFVFDRNLQKLNKNKSDFVFENQDPGVASQAMQTLQPDVKNIMVWNPFKLQTLRTRKDAKSLFDSTSTKEEVIDGVVIGKDVLEKPKGEAFAVAVCEAYYQFNKLMKDPSVGDEVIVELGSKFCNLPLEDMKICCTETKFYDSPKAAEELIISDKFSEINKIVLDWCLSNSVVEKQPSVGVNKSWKDDFDLIFTTEFIKKVNN